MNASRIRHLKSIVGFVVIISMIITAFYGAWGYLYSYGAGSGASSYDKIMTDKAPEDYDPDDKTNPYTSNNKNFTIVEDSELLIYRSFNVDSTADKEQKNIGVSTYNKYNPDYDGNGMNICDDLATKKGGWESSTGTNYDMGGTDDDYAHGLNFTECVAFDPNGVGSDDHVAFIGIQGGGSIYIWVYDAVNDTYGARRFIGSCANADLSVHSAKKFFTITAGDYNNDGKDTVVIYYPVTEDDYQLLEYTVNGTSLKEAEWNRSFLHPQYQQETSLYNSEDWCNRLGCDLTTGDFNGDGIDDLGVISFVQDVSTSKLKQKSPKLFLPYLTVAYGSDKLTEGDILWSRETQSTYLGTDTSTNVKTTMRSPSISAGDVDGDGIDEIVAAGYSCTVKTDKAGYSDKIDYDHITAFEVVSNKESIVSSGSTLNVNGWTNGVVDNNIDGDGYENQVSVECVAFNGQAAKEKVFINGTIYEYQGAGSFNAVYTPKYFDSDDKTIHDGIQAKSGTIEAISGIFDGNDQGREQIMFYYCMNEYGSATGNDYYYGLGSIYATGYDSSNASTGYDSENYHWALSNVGGGNDQRLSFCLAAVDRDHDNLVGSYSGKTYTYADPNVTAVIQAAPYFSEINDAGGYANNSETSYAISVDYAEVDTKSNNVSFAAGAGFQAEGDLEISVDFELRLGYALSYSDSYEKEELTEHLTEWTAYGEDQVVICRIPIIIYQYDLMKNNKSCDDGMTISVPGTPTYTTLSIDDYNAFVDEYNEKMDKALEEYNSKVSDPKDKQERTNTLLKINKSSNKLDADIPADTSGNPENYWDKWSSAKYNSGESLSQYPIQLGYSSGKQTSLYEKSTAETEGKSSGHGFSFETSLLFGGGALGTHIRAGLWASLEYLHETGEYTIDTEGISTAGTVENIDEAALVAAGMPAETVRNYGFTWEFGQWKIPLTSEEAKTDDKEQYTPFLGYIVYDISQPPKAPENLYVDNSDTDSLHELVVSWDKSENALVQGYNLYVSSGDEYEKVNDEMIPKNQTSYTVDELDSNTEYSFVLTCYGYADKKKAKWGESSFSPEATGKTTRDSYNLTLSPGTGGVIKATSGGRDISTGGIVMEGDAVKIEASAKQGYTLTSVVLKKGDTSKNITSADGKFNFSMSEDTEIIVEAARNNASGVSSIRFTTKSLNSVGGNQYGSIQVFADGESFKSGAQVMSDEITLTAAPEEGYTLQKWVIKTEGEPDIEIMANGELSYDFGPYATGHDIEAVFVEEDDDSVSKKIEVNCSNGGKIVITDEDGKTLEKAEGEDYYRVPTGSELTFTATPDDHYKLLAWTGAFSSINKKNKEYTYDVYEDLKIGANFYAPVKYTVDYELSDTALASITANLDKGEAYVPDTELKLTVTPDTADGEKYRLESWTIVSGTDEETVDVDEYKSSYEYSMKLEDNTKVTANIIDREEYQLKLLNDDEIEYTVTNQNGDAVTDGDTILYGDELTVKWAAKKGYKLKGLTINDEAAENECKVTVKSDISANADCYRLISDETTGKADDSLKIDIQGTEFIYSGEALTPEVVVSIDDQNSKDKLLTEGDDYTIEYKNNDKAGTAKVIVTAKGRYKGVAEKEFKIVPKKFKLTWNNTDEVKYTVTNQDGKTVTDNGDIFYDDVLSVKCEAKKGYELKALAVNSEAAKNNATYVVKSDIELDSECYRLLADQNSGKADESLRVELLGEKFIFSGEALTPVVKVSIDDQGKTAVILAKDKDYSVEYQDNDKLGKGKIIIKGLGRYKGTVVKEFTIEPKQYKLSCADTDEVKYIVSYKSAKTVSDGGAIFYGDELSLKCYPNAGYELKELRANGLTVKNNSTIVVNSDLAIDAECYRLLVDAESGKEDESLKVEIAGSEFSYCGEAIVPEVSVSIDDGTSKAKKLKAGEDYTIEYSDNTKPGTAKIQIVGIGRYKGSISRSFGILDNPSLYSEEVNSSASIGMSKNKISLTWGAVGLADGYDVYVAKCGNDFPKKPTLSTEYKFAKISKLRGKTISAKSRYKALVVPYRLNGEEHEALTKTVVLHIAGSGTKYTNAKNIKGLPKSCTIAVGKTKALKAKIVKANKKKSLISNKHCASLRYTSSDKAVATVSKKGVIKALAPGSCEIRVMAANGVSKTIAVTVE